MDTELDKKFVCIYVCFTLALVQNTENRFLETDSVLMRLVWWTLDNDNNEITHDLFS